MVIADLSLKVATLQNASAVSLSDIPLLEPYEFRHEITSRLQHGGRLANLFAMPQGPEHARLFAVLGDPLRGLLTVCSAMVGSRSIALSSTIPQAGQFERETHQGSQHRGIERALIGGPDKRTPHLIETLSGDNTVGHTTAYCEVVEALSSTAVPMRAQAIRGIALELERLTNHTGDLGSLAGSVGFRSTSDFCGRLRDEFLDIMALLGGNRMGRTLIRPGGVGFDLEAARIEEIYERLSRSLPDVAGAVRLLWKSPSVQSRFEKTGTISADVSRQLGLVGPAARASGDEIDVRRDYPSGIYRYHQIATSTVGSGDVFARAFVRWLEIQRSVDYIQQQLEFVKKFRSSPIRTHLNTLRADALAVSLVEGWRGEICHVGITNSDGRFAHYKICDPSFHNRPGLELALQGQQLSDFSLIEQSFHLSNAGCDL